MNLNSKLMILLLMVPSCLTTVGAAAEETSLDLDLRPAAGCQLSYQGCVTLEATMKNSGSKETALHGELEIGRDIRIEVEVEPGKFEAVACNFVSDIRAGTPSTNLAVGASVRSIRAVSLCFRQGRFVPWDSREVRVRAVYASRFKSSDPRVESSVVTIPCAQVASEPASVQDLFADSNWHQLVLGSVPLECDTTVEKAEVALASAPGGSCSALIHHVLACRYLTGKSVQGTAPKMDREGNIVGEGPCMVTVRDFARARDHFAAAAAVGEFPLRDWANLYLAECECELRHEEAAAQALDRIDDRTCDSEIPKRIPKVRERIKAETRAPR
ncbi:MAG: hypothetical protein HYY93_12525 [Planctomycetes bacterium]|nr:hypothetical protein [Planctomycetota bacterium]